VRHGWNAGADSLARQERADLCVRPSGSTGLPVTRSTDKVPLRRALPSGSSFPFPRGRDDSHPSVPDLRPCVGRRMHPCRDRGPAGGRSHVSLLPAHVHASGDAESQPSRCDDAAERCPRGISESSSSRGSGTGRGSSLRLAQSPRPLTDRPSLRESPQDGRHSVPRCAPGFE